MEQDYVDKQLDAKIIEINNDENVYEIGTVVNVKDFIIEVTGISNVMFYEKINIADKALGYVNSINENTITVAVLKINSPINIGDMVYSTNTLYTGSYSKSSLGRVIDLFGEDKLSGKKYSDLIDIPIERKTIPIMDRGTVSRPLLTGISGIDLMYPIGRGQRQLIIGDKRTGKTQIGLDTIVNQKNQNVLCFYVAIGKTKKEVKNIYSELMKKGALDYTTIITAFNDELPPVISLIPYFALSIAQNYMMEKRDVLVVIDDLKRHAEAYREISLISGKTPGRDAYPADIFYTHSRLLEKGCQHKDGGSITILPIVETKGGDITDYISTNIISITDGQIVLSDKSFQKGEKPAINYGLSVSRLGGAVQEGEMKVIGSQVRRKLLSYLETRNIYELVNMDEMSLELKNQFMEGKIILSNLMQYKFSPKTPQEMIDTFADIVEVDINNYNDNQNIEQDNNSINNSVDNNSNIPLGLNQMPKEIPFELNQMPKEIPFELNKMPEEIPMQNNDVMSNDGTFESNEDENSEFSEDIDLNEQLTNIGESSNDISDINGTMDGLVVPPSTTEYDSDSSNNSNSEVDNDYAEEPIIKLVVDENVNIDSYNNNSDDNQYNADNGYQEDLHYSESNQIQNSTAQDSEENVEDNFNNTNLVQEVSIDNPVTEKDESVEDVKTSLNDDVSINYNFNEDSNSFESEDNSSYEEEYNYTDTENDNDNVYEEESQQSDLRKDVEEKAFEEEVI